MAVSVRRLVRFLLISMLVCSEGVGAAEPASFSGGEIDGDLEQPESSAAGLETIVVTAQRRPEDLQQAPISVISLSASDLDSRSATDLRSLQYFVPNLTFAPSQSVGDAAANIFIRGIGQEDFVAGSEPGVGLYVDGIYIARTMGAFIQLIDIDHVEVLRGPQGTLYGRNSIGGSINLVSTEPSSVFEGHFGILAGSRERLEASAMMNLPITDRLLLRGSAKSTKREGYLHRMAGPDATITIIEADLRPEGRDETTSGRLQLRWLAGPSWTVDLTSDLSRRRGTQAPTHIDTIDPAQRILPSVNQLISAEILPGPLIDENFVSADLLKSHAGGGNVIEQDMGGLSLRSSWKTGDSELRLTAAYRKLDSLVATDSDGTYFDILTSKFDENYTQKSLEALVLGKAGQIAYTAGIFAIREQGRSPPVAGAGATVLYYCGCFYPPDAKPTIIFPARSVASESVAVFGQVTGKLFQEIDLTLGSRLTQDRKGVAVELVSLEPLSPLATNNVIASGKNNGQWTSLTWRFAMSYRLEHDVMIYGSIATGYKSGGINLRPSPTLPNLGLAEFSPEELTTYETGLRSQSLNDRLRFNITAFVSNYHDIQLRQQTSIGGLMTNTLIENAAKARIHGLETEIAVMPRDWLIASLSYGRASARYLDIGEVPDLSLVSRFQRTPKDSLALSLDIVRPIRDGQFEFHIDYSFRSKEQFQITASQWDQPAYGLWRARLSFRSGSHWSIALSGTNLTDVRYRSAGRGNAVSQFGFAQSIIGPPRQVAVEVKWST